MQTEPRRERDGYRTRVPTPAAMRARDVSRPSDADLAAAELEADRLIDSRLSGRAPRRQERESGATPDRS